jgi:hypothetical protein
MNNKYYLNISNEIFEEVTKAIGPLSQDQINLIELVVAIAVKVHQKTQEKQAVIQKDRLRGYEL